MAARALRWIALMAAVVDIQLRAGTGAVATTAEIVPLLPAPTRCEANSGSFTLGADTVIQATAGATRDALGEGLRRLTGFDLAFAPPAAIAAGTTAITLALTAPPSHLTNPGGGQTNTADEAYTLVIGPKHIAIEAADDAGLFYGVQSLLQLVEAQNPTRGQLVTLSALTVADRPRFAWRGFMLDESRHFFGKPTVEALLDAMARLKLNRFHWHLTDEPGWRIEIKAYPKLTEVGAIGNWSDPGAPRQFYTQAEIREIVAYAQQRHIVVIPEIDMPGHATAATRAYPELSGGGTGQWAGFTFNPVDDQTYAFLSQVLREVADLFPGPYLHIGGDEVRFGIAAWATNPAIARFMREHSLATPSALEGYFMQRLATVVRHLGKRPLGWDEIASDGVSPDGVIAMWWRHDKPEILTQLLGQNFSVILSPRLPCYFDFVQDETHRYGRRWNGYNDLDRVYHFPDAVIAGRVPEGKAHNILGVEACLWTEQVQTTDRLWFMIFPRLAALAEDGWSETEVKNDVTFRARLRPFLRSLDHRGIRYFNPFEPASTPEPAGPTKKAAGTASG